MAEARKPVAGGALKPHPLVEALVPNPGDAPIETITLAGLPGRSPTTGSVRLWLDEALTRYVDIPNTAIRYSHVLDGDRGTVVWIDAGASIQQRAREVEAGFLDGAIARDRLAGARTGLRRDPTQEGTCWLTLPSWSLGCSPVCPEPGYRPPINRGDPGPTATRGG